MAISDYRYISRAMRPPGGACMRARVPRRCSDDGLALIVLPGM